MESSEKVPWCLWVGKKMIFTDSSSLTCNSSHTLILDPWAKVSCIWSSKCMSITADSDTQVSHTHTPTHIHTHTELKWACLQLSVMPSRSKSQFNCNYASHGEGPTKCRSHLSPRAGPGNTLTLPASFSASKLWCYHLEQTEPVVNSRRTSHRTSDSSVCLEILTMLLKK